MASLSLCSFYGSTTRRCLWALSMWTGNDDELELTHKRITYTPHHTAEECTQINQRKNHT